MNKIIENLEWRYACKKFDSTKKVSTEDLNTILDGVILTASSYGMQPWEFVVVTNDKVRSDLVAASYNQAQVKDASHLIVLCVRKEIDEKLVDSYIGDISKKRGLDLDSLEGFKKMLMTLVLKEDKQKAAWAKNQVYIALGNLLNICSTLRIDSCPMEGISPKKYGEILGLSELGLKAVLACPIGYRSGDDNYADVSKVRFDKKELIKFID